MESSQPAALYDRIYDERLTAGLRAIPSVKTALEGGELRKLKAAADVVAGKLVDDSLVEALRGLTGGGLVFAVEAGKGQKPRAYLIVTLTDAGVLKKTSAALIDLARQDADAKGSLTR